MATTTSYGTWGSYTNVTSIEDTVNDFIGGGGDEWIGRLVQSGGWDRVVDAFRAAINTNLPGGITLHGNDFYGPYPLEDGVRPDQLKELIPDVINNVDLGSIVMDNDPDLQNS